MSNSILVTLRPGLQSPLRRSVRDDDENVIRVLEFQPNVVVELTDPLDIEAVQRDLERGGIVEAEADEKGRVRVAIVTKTDPKLAADLNDANEEIKRLTDALSEEEERNKQLVEDVEVLAVDLKEAEADIDSLINQLKEAGIEPIVPSDEDPHGEDGEDRSTKPDAKSANSTVSESQASADNDENDEAASSTATASGSGSDKSDEGQKSPTKKATKKKTTKKKPAG